MAETFPPWRVLGRRRIYTNDWISVDFWSVRLPDGTVIDDYTVLDYPRPAVAVLPIGADSRVLMIDHYRFITDTRGWELPAGRVDPGESVDAAAERELFEETGHSATSWTTLGQYHPSNGSSNQVFYVKIARDLTRGRTRRIRTRRWRSGGSSRARSARCSAATRSKTASPSPA